MNQIDMSTAVTKSWGRLNSPLQNSSSQSRQYREGRYFSGFSLVELMVAMVIGMLGIIVMMQMFSMFEGQKRTTTGGDDAISGGAVALYSVQRDIQQSGWGLSALQMIGCNVTGLASGTTIPLVPVTIFPSGVNALGVPLPDSNTDSLMVVSGNGNGTVEGDNIDSHGTDYAVHTPSAFSAGPPADLVVAVPQSRPSATLCGPGSSNLALTPVSAVASPNVTVTTDIAGIATGDKLFNLGSSPRVRVYAIRNQNLTVCDFSVSDCTADISAMTPDELAVLWLPVANNVVSLRAQYGRDTNAAGMDAMIDAWDQTVATPATPVGNYGPACGLLRISALRIALVARSSQPERRLDGTVTSTEDDDYVTPNVPAWAGSTGAAISPPSPSASWPTWQDFRYKVFQTVVPLRNITTMGVVDGC